jgi:hypothetical protein
MALTTKRAAALVALVPAAVAVCPAAPATLADDGREHRSTETFQGTCQFAGTLRQNPPLTNIPQLGWAEATARGRCTGTFTDSNGRSRHLDSARAGYFARARGTTSCAGGTAAGNGFIRFGGERLDFRFSEIRGPGAGAIRLEGERSGSAHAAARVSDDEDPVRIARLCSGPGLRQVGIQIDLATTPAISG